MTRAHRALKPLNQGDVISGAIIRKTAKETFFDLGAYGVGYLYGREYMASRDEMKGAEVGTALTVKIVEENPEGYWEVTLRGTLDLEKWQRATHAMQDKETFEMTIKQANWGGLLVDLEGLGGFVPVSQLSLAHYPRVEGGSKNLIVQELQKLVGQTLKLRIIDVDPRNQKLIFSERATEEMMVKELIARCKVGDVVEGEISGLTKFGAFFAFGNPPLEGLIHVSEISNALVLDPAEILRVHEARKAKIIKIENDRIFLSLKDLERDAALVFLETHPIGSELEATVVSVKPGQARVKITDELTGVLAEFSEELQAGAAIKTKVLGSEKNCLILKQA